MTKEEFIKIAKDFGYSKEAIDTLVALKNETGLEYDEIAIAEHIVD